MRPKAERWVCLLGAGPARPSLSPASKSGTSCVNIRSMKPSAIDLHRVETALDIMIQKVDRADPVALAGEAVGVGRRQLERHFRRLGTSPHKELSRIRAQLAAGELTVQEGNSIRLLGVARRVGFQDERRLREATSKSYGLSPGELRQGARLKRRFQQDEAIRRSYRGSKIAAGLWSEYRRRRNRAILDGLLRKATPAGVKAILGQATLPRPSAARRTSGQLARKRVMELRSPRSEAWRDAA